MNEADNIWPSLTENDIRDAAHRAFREHGSDAAVREFCSHFDERCSDLYCAIKDGSWKSLLSYTPMRKCGRNGKVRDIDRPDLNTRIYQHLFLNLIEPLYFAKDNLNGLNCKPGCGVTASASGRSVIKRLKHIYYDRLDLKYCLVIDQRKCYEHITRSVFRKSLKFLTSDRHLIDFAVGVTFIGDSLPIGTPTSPMVHHIVMLKFDYFVKALSGCSLRYADDNFLAFHTAEEAHSAKWRIKNFWWYELGIRSKRQTIVIQPMDVPLDFCGYVFHRNGRGKCQHNKGYVKIRKSIADAARKCKNDHSWSAYFGLMKNADTFSLMTKIEQDMKLRELTQKIRIDRNMDARNIEMKEVVGKTLTVYDYEIRYNSQKQANWIKCLVGIDEVIDGEKTGKMLAYEFHGNYQGIIQFMLACEEKYGKNEILPLEEVEIENQCGYIFKGSTNQMTYIEDNNNEERTLL